MRVRPHGHRSARLTAAALVASVTLGGALTGCSGGASGKQASSGSTSSSGSPSPSTSGSSSPSPSATPAPSPPKEPKAAKDTAATRKAFAAFVVASWGYALRTNDAPAVTGLALKGHPCQGCKDFSAELAKRRKQQWYVALPGVKVHAVAVSPSSAPHTYLARAKIDVPASQSLFEDGSFRNENPAHRGATFEVLMVYAGKSYRLLGFEVR